MDKKLLTSGEERRLCVPHMNQTAVTEAGEEYTLADYFPEVRRVVTTLCRVLPERLYDGGDTARIDGTVAFTVLYVGDDGTLCAAPLTTDFSASVPMADGGDGTVAVADTVAESVTCRATGPRRLTLRARLRTTVTSHRQVSCDTAVTADAGDAATAEEIISVQTLEAVEDSLIHGVGRITGNATGELREASGVKPILCDGEIIVTDTSLAGGTVTVRGEAMMWCLCYSPEGVYYRASSKTPFEEKIPLEGGVPESGSSRAFGRCASVTVKEGGDGVLLWDMEYDLECEGVDSVPVTVAKDLYSTMWDSAVTHGEHQCLSPLKCGNGRLTVSSSAKHEGEGGSVIASFGGAVCEKVEREGDRMIITGTADIHAVICGGGDAVEEVLRIPFRYECDRIPEGDGDIVWRCDASLWDPSVTLDGDTLRASGEVCISIIALRKRPVSYASGLVLDRTPAEDSGDGILRIYFPSEGESPWDITKKYRINKNAVTEASQGGVVIR